MYLCDICWRRDEGARYWMWKAFFLFFSGFWEHLVTQTPINYRTPFPNNTASLPPPQILPKLIHRLPQTPPPNPNLRMLFRLILASPPLFQQRLERRGALSVITAEGPSVGCEVGPAVRVRRGDAVGVSRGRGGGRGGSGEGESGDCGAGGGDGGAAGCGGDVGGGGGWGEGSGCVAGHAGGLREDEGGTVREGRGTYVKALCQHIVVIKEFVYDCSLSMAIVHIWLTLPQQHEPVIYPPSLPPRDKSRVVRTASRDASGVARHVL
ncbi:hypothetical protein G7K_1387-t1 [Saitoella complicata NRRL Y-17804]|uniref:Uncharacterized protein n=1 Tax=Saitoella complicata (strain BCRC 22490 / CBS 7301 / JCM 7358 / NBRC 10748 / NRRL Y-17804) TaxID=698492 RepID=A0A0E9NBU3_SAICN|nr:hypothetical protein G7K_1387-t1 [Saitoella complicata NRRL Y-17804]